MIFQANGADFYINGHDHCLEHISSKDRLTSICYELIFCSNLKLKMMHGNMLILDEIEGA